jgi:hypothetical protein
MGLGLPVWPLIVSPPDTAVNATTVIRSLLGALAALSLVGLQYPLQILPLLVFELLWKVIWVVAFALRMWLFTGLDDYARDTLFACLMGVVLVPIVIPWGYSQDSCAVLPTRRPPPPFGRYRRRPVALSLGESKPAKPRGSPTRRSPQVRAPRRVHGSYVSCIDLGSCHSPLQVVMQRTPAALVAWFVRRRPRVDGSLGRASATRDALDA